MAVAFSPTIKEALCAFEAFRRVGYPADDIYVSVDHVEGMGAVLGVLGKWNENSIKLGVGGLSDEEDASFKEVWEAACLWWNTTASEQERQNLWLHSKMYDRSVSFCIELAKNNMLRRREPNFSDACA